VRSLLPFLVASFAVASLAGCAAYQNVGVQSEPSGANIYLDGALVGKTPAQLEVPRGAAHTIYLKRDGYRPELVVLERHTADDEIDYLTPADVVKHMSPGPSSDPETERQLKIEIERKP
jgi:hypothetical protein